MRRSTAGSWGSRAPASPPRSPHFALPALARSGEHTPELPSRPPLLCRLFFLNAPAPPDISPLPLHDALPFLGGGRGGRGVAPRLSRTRGRMGGAGPPGPGEKKEEFCGGRRGLSRASSPP